MSSRTPELRLNAPLEKYRRRAAGPELIALLFASFRVTRKANREGGQIVSSRRMEQRAANPFGSELQIKAATSAQIR